MRSLFAQLRIVVVLLILFTYNKPTRASNEQSRHLIDGPQNCTKINSSPIIQQAYIGWPVSIDCQELLQELQILYWSELYDSDDDYIHLQKQCLIWDMEQGLTVLNSSFDLWYTMPNLQLPDLQQNHTLNYEVSVHVHGFNICLSTIIRIQPVRLENLTCQEALNSSKHIQIKGVKGSKFEFKCTAPSNEKIQLSKGQYTPTTHKWFKNCNELTRNQDNAGTFPVDFRIRNITYQHVGVYTCALLHNNQFWYIGHYQLCVKPPFTNQEYYSVTCSSTTVSTNTGQHSKIKCVVYVGITAHTLIYSAMWRKGNDLVCQYPRRSNSRTQCSLKVQDVPCFNEVPTEVEIEQYQSQTVTLTLTIDNLQESDFGEYVVTLTNHFKKVSVEGRVTLSPSRTNSLVRSTIGIGVGISLIVLIFFVLSAYFFCKRNRIKIVKRKASIEETMTISETV